MGFFCLIENIYLSLSFISNIWKGDLKYYGEFFENYLLEGFEKLRVEALDKQVFIFDDVEVVGGIKRYPYGFKVADKFRFYFARNVGDNYPVMCVVSAAFLHLNNVEYVLDLVEAYLRTILRFFVKDIEVERILKKVSRVDFCNHNDEIDLDTYIRMDEKNSRVVTRLKQCFSVMDLVGQRDVREGYYRYGKGDIVVRFYNKVQEICEMRYKSFFFLKWLQDGLIDLHTFDVYDMTYRLNRDYHLDFLYANLYFSGLSDEDKRMVTKLYYDKKMGVSEIYDRMDRFRKEKGIKLVKEIVNVEFQLRSGFLREVRIKDKGTGKVIKFDNVEDLFKCANELYRYLTKDVFRVIARGYNYTRKRDMPMDKIWERLHNSEVLNISNKYESRDLDLYREYQNRHDILDALRKASSAISRYYYLVEDKITFEDVKKIKPERILGEFTSGYVEYMNENYFELRERLERQLKYYGEKSF